MRCSVPACSKRPESISQLIDHANSHPAPIAVDIPSGLLAETGATLVISASHHALN
nr:NAD(P)H-hydrate epimerase [Shigella flexneri]